MYLFFFFKEFWDNKKKKAVWNSVHLMDTDDYSLTTAFFNWKWKGTSP